MQAPLTAESDRATRGMSECSFARPQLSAAGADSRWGGHARSVAAGCRPSRRCDARTRLRAASQWRPADDEAVCPFDRTGPPTATHRKYAARAKPTSPSVPLASGQPWTLLDRRHARSASCLTVVGRWVLAAAFHGVQGWLHQRKHHNLLRRSTCCIERSLVDGSSTPDRRSPVGARSPGGRPRRRTIRRHFERPVRPSSPCRSTGHAGTRSAGSHALKTLGVSYARLRGRHVARGAALSSPPDPALARGCKCRYATRQMSTS
jgi:hypothetical protein